MSSLICGTESLYRCLKSHVNRQARKEKQNCAEEETRLMWTGEEEKGDRDSGEGGCYMLWKWPRGGQFSRGIRINRVAPLIAAIHLHTPPEAMVWNSLLSHHKLLHMLTNSLGHRRGQE